MKVNVNEKIIEIPEGTSLLTIKKTYKSDADIVILNGAPVSNDVELHDSDNVVLIKRGEIPTSEELEALMYSRHTPGVHDKIKNATIGLAGAGGLGSAIAVALTRVGIGKLIIADFDVVEPSNLNRQQYFISQIGMEKVEALKENLKQINPYVTVETHTVRLTPHNIPEIYNNVNVMLEAFDKPEQKVMLVETFKDNFPEIPFIAASGMAGYHSNNSIKTINFAENYYIVGDLEIAACPGEGLMAPRVGIAAHHQANCALRLLLGIKDVED